MKILLLSYSDYNYDGRLRALIDVFSQIGDLHCFVRKAPMINNITTCDDNYFSFIIKSIAFYKKNMPFDLLVLDNRKATIPGLIIHKLFKPSFIIQDSRELYLFDEVNTFSSKLGCIFERMMSKKSNIVICANEYRSIIMKEKYGLKNKPLVYENLRKLKYDSEQECKEAETKFKDYVQDEDFHIISTSGCSNKRTTDILVNNLNKVEKKCRLFLVGDSSKEDLDIIQNIIKTNHLNNVFIFGKLNQAELKYLISKSHLGIVNYGQYDTNNKYCASGKLYEFLYEGIPVVTTTNPPLLEMCYQYKIGESDDTYYDAINRIMNNYDYYKTNVIKYI